MTNITEEILPQFDDIQEALDSESPFRLTSRTRFFRKGDIKQIPNNKRRLVLNALLFDDKFRMSIEDEEDLDFVISLLREHNRIKSLDIYLRTNNDTIINNLAVALETSHVVRLKLDPQGHYAPILRALKDNKILRKLKLRLEPKPDDLESLVSAISNENLEVFVLRQCFSYEDMSSLWHAIEHVLSTHKSLKTLKPIIFNNTLGQVLGEILTKNTMLQRLDLGQAWEDAIGEISIDCMTLLCNGLVKNSTLQELFVSHLSDGAASVLFASLAHDQCQVSSLMMSNVLLTDEDIRHLSDSLKTNTKLKRLEFSVCGMDFNFWVLCEGLKENKSITELHINGGYIENDRVYKEKEIVNAVCDLLTHNDRLTTLTLSHNWMEDDDEHCRMIGEMLTKNKSLTDLRVTTCGNNGVNIICEALLQHTTLKKLHLGPINTVQSMTGVKNLLVHNCTLRHLHIDINMIVDERVNAGIDAICEGLKCNNSLVNLVLDWRDWSFDKTSLPQVIAALQDNYALDKISLNVKASSLNPTTQPLKALARPFLRRNRQLKSDIRFKVAILSHNIARSSHALTILPREIWKLIFSFIKSPGVDLDQLVLNIFDSYLTQ